jgi:hypothetical protein
LRTRGDASLDAVAELKASLEKLPADRQDQFRRELKRQSGK